MTGCIGRENTYISNRDLVPREPAIPVLQSSRGTTTDSNSADDAFAPNGAPDAAAEKPHVALFLPSLVSGGAERVMLHIAEGLAEHGASVDLVLSRVEGEYVSQVPANVRVVDLGGSRVISSLPSLIQYLRRERPTALLSALAHANLVALWATLIARTNTRVVVAVHSTLSLSTRFSPRRRDRLVPWLSRLFYRRAARVVAVSRGSAQDLIALTNIDEDLVDRSGEGCVHLVEHFHHFNDIQSITRFEMIALLHIQCMLRGLPAVKHTAAHGQYFVGFSHRRRCQHLDHGLL